MILKISPQQQAALAGGFQDRLAVRIAAQAGAPDQAPRFRAYIDEAVAAGVVLEDDVTDLCIALFEIDSVGRRPPEVVARLSDPEVDGALKVMQVEGAWLQHLRPD